MKLHMTDRTIYEHMTGKRNLTYQQLSHLAACARCSELLKVVKNLKKYIDVAEAKKKMQGPDPTD